MRGIHLGKLVIDFGGRVDIYDPHSVEVLQRYDYQFRFSDELWHLPIYWSFGDIAMTLGQRARCIFSFSRLPPSSKTLRMYACICQLQCTANLQGTAHLMRTSYKRKSRCTSCGTHNV